MAPKVLEILTLILFFVFNTESRTSLKTRRKMFRKTIRNYKIKLRSKKEYQYRFEIFSKNLKIIEGSNESTTDSGAFLIGSNGNIPYNPNSGSQNTYDLCVNYLAFLSEKEFKNMYLVSYREMFNDPNLSRQRKEYEHTFEYFKENFGVEAPNEAKGCFDSKTIRKNNIETEANAKQDNEGQNNQVSGQDKANSLNESNDEQGKNNFYFIIFI